MPGLVDVAAIGLWRESLDDLTLTNIMCFHAAQPQRRSKVLKFTLHPELYPINALTIPQYN
jgi:hypothetical protein